MSAHDQVDRLRAIADPIGVGLARINNIMQGPARPTRATGLIPDDLADQARDTITAVCIDEKTIDRMINAPWRITKAVYPHVNAVWPIIGKSATRVLVDCREFIEAQKEAGRAGNWVFDFNRLIALR